MTLRGSGRLHLKHPIQDVRTSTVEITQVLAGIAVADLDRAAEWYEVMFGRPADAEPMGRPY
jgi:hypothetical protein